MKIGEHMTNINLAISKLPFIIEARKNNMSYKDIQTILNEKLQLNISEVRLRKLVSEYKNDNIKPKFKSLKIGIIELSDLLLEDEIRPNIIRLNGGSELFFLANSDFIIDDKYKFTKDNIIKIRNPVDRIQAKWLGRLFDIPDNSIINIEGCSQDQINEINLIPDNIDKIFEQINKDILYFILSKKL
jgi:hypothetical protein